jgi:type IV pilus assembly protein PilY1
MSRFVLRAVIGAAPLGLLLCVATHANAQIAGTTTRPLPNVLLLVDTSGSMERMGDSSLPSANRLPPSMTTNVCVPGVQSNPNRWGMLLQALTGNLQPFYSCDAVDRSSNEFNNEFKIGSNAPYDANYFLPYHRPLTGVAATACTMAPWKLPGGTGSGTSVGPGGAGYAGGDVRDLPPDAFAQVLNVHLKAQYSSFGGSPLMPSSNACVFEQAVDGQLDAAKDYIRFGLMTFDNDTDPGVGVTIPTPQPSGNVSANPFTGQWSYVKSPANTMLSTTPSPLAFGLPGGCAGPATAFEVGARHAGAPPWEGRMVPFPPPSGDLYDLETTNDNIQKVLLGTRPYGATPIDGMMEDARDYLWFNDFGPNGTGANKDPYVASSCRDQYIILLTDGAPNLDLRPSCEQTGGQCPFNKAADIADKLAQATGSGKQVTTYVIGFSVNGSGDPSFVNDGFPAGVTDCKAWYANSGGTPGSMRSVCMTAPIPPKGSTADACCQLNEIAYYGAPLHDVGPFFAETQADLVLSFGRILGGVSKTASTRTLPGYAPAVSIGSPAVGSTGDFIASFIPNARKVWSGEIDRTRSVCAGAIPLPQVQSVTEGDSYAANLAAQSITKRRLFISVLAQTTSASPGPGPAVDSARTIRPYAAAPTDGIPAFTGTEVMGLDDALKGEAGWAEALDIDANTCKRSKAVTPGTGATVPVPALTKTDCKDVIWQFATAKFGGTTYSGYDFNVRCPRSGNPASGRCSVSGTTGCSVASASTCPIPGEVCVPDCSALGAVYRSSPALVGTPNQFLRDDSYQKFAAAKITRRPTMYVATADGVLHAFKALATSAWDPNDFEMWAFVPPAVLPKLASNYPTGQQILLDGTPVVKDVVWDRKPSDPVTATQYKTTLVAGMGAGGPGYYALNVSDTDCGGYPGSVPACLNGKFVAANSKSAVETNPGPHFLWQFTDIEWDGMGDPAKQVRKARDGTQLVALFGKESGTPAITTLQVDPGDGLGLRQVGVAILPGGIDGPPIKGAWCARAMDGGAQVPYSASLFDFSDPAKKRRAAVRAWGADCKNSPVPGRGVTIVRLDTGEVLRHFGRKAQDVPRKLQAKTIDSPFDSPVIGTPVVYPNLIGATAQKVFIGDADGAVWRIDVSASDPNAWRATLFQDLISVDLPAPAKTFADSQPIRVPPVLSLDPSGGIVINVATGDQENLTAGTEKNYIYSIQEGRPSAVTAAKASVRWYKELVGSERVTGPMTVFDRTLYFATYTPAVPTSGACANGGTPTLWGMDFFNPSLSGPNQGGAPRWCQLGKVDALSGACLVGLTQNENPAITYPTLAGAIIPGVTIRASQSCASFDSTPGDPALTGLTSTKFDIFFGATNSRAGSGTGTPQAARPEVSLTRPLPRTTAVIDAWALVVD